MGKRTWISAKQLFWSKEEWQEAMNHYAQEPSFQSLSGGDQVSKLVGYLTNKYPVEQKELQKVKS